MRILLLIFKLLGFFINHAPEKEKFYIEDKWTIELPLDWEKKPLKIKYNFKNLMSFTYFF